MKFLLVGSSSSSSSSNSFELESELSVGGLSVVS